MLDYAKKHEEDLKRLYLDTAFNSFYMFEQCSVYRGTLVLPEDTWSANHFVSIHEGKILGIVSYQIRRADNLVDDLHIVHFGGKKAPNPYIFGKDALTAIEDVFIKYGFNKISFRVVMGNPIEKTYDRLVKRYGGRIVGIKRQDVRLMDGKLYDMKEYEILAEDFHPRKRH
jgi:Flp pilus assembly secretin CpaC